jgi:hypothetical protein
MTNSDFRNSLSIQSLIQTLWIVVGSLVGIHVLLNLFHYQVHELPWLVRQIFDVDEEDSFPTWYSASALLLTSAILWVNATSQRKYQSSHTWHWYGLAVGFLLLSIDEIAGMHETLNSETEMSWAIPGGVLALFIGGVYLVFLCQLERHTAVQFVIGGALFVGGAVGVELLTEPYLENDELNTLAYNLWTAVEEGMEMAGVIVFLNALLLMMKGQASEPEIRIKLTR